MEILVAVAILVGIVWGAVALCRGGLLAGGLIVLLAGIFLGSSLFQIPVQPIPLTADRIAWAILMVQLFVAWRMGFSESRPLGRTEWLLIAFLGLLAATIVTHDWTVTRNQPIVQFVFCYLMPFGVYWAGWRAKIDERGLKALFAILGGVGLYVALLAVAEKGGLTWLIYPRYIITSENQEFLGRARGPLLNPAANGILLGWCLAAGLMMWTGAHRPGRLLLLGGAFFVCVGIFCTLTRSAWMGGSLGLLLLVVLVLPRIYRPWLVAAAVLGSVLVLATQWENILEFKRDKNLDASATAESAQLRPVLAAIAWEMFCDRPILGCGLGQYPTEHLNYFSERDAGIPLALGRGYSQHNIWLSLLTETGLLGMSLYAAIVILWLRAAWRLWRARSSPLWMRQQGLVFLVLAVNYLMNGMFQDMTLVPMVQMIFLFMAGVTVNLQRRTGEMEKGSESVAAAGVAG